MSRARQRAAPAGQSGDELQRWLSILRATLESTADGILVVDLAGRVVTYNQKFLKLWNMPEEVLTQWGFDRRLAYVQDQLADPDAWLRKARELLARPEAESFDVLVFKDGRIIERYSQPQRVGDRIVGRVWSFRDVTARRRAEEGLRFLADASRALSSSLDVRSTLTSLVRLAAPRLADWCVVDMVENRHIHRIASAHRDPAKEPLLRELDRRFPPDWESPQPGTRALRTRQAELIEEVTDDILRSRTRSAEHRDLVRALGIRSMIAAPLIARGQLLGSISLVCDRRRYDKDDLGVVRELADRAAVAIDNARLYEEAQAASKAKSDFLAVMSHELRTPLNAITGYADLLDAGVAGPVTERQRQYLDRIGAQAADLLRIINEILSFSRMEAGRERLRLSHVAVSDVVREIAAKHEPIARAKGLGFRVRAMVEPATIVTDHDKLINILDNLLSNAIKFTNQGEVQLTAWFEKHTIVFRVRDTGIGIPAEYHERIFDPFFQLEEAMTREKGGTGLGLTVARRLARLLGGDVSVESAPGRGSTFTLRLPANPSD
ncbi:MAG TPA: ATP-binding protein [Longimicrobiales bacterium]